MPSWEGREVYCDRHRWLLLMDNEGIVRHATHGTLCDPIPVRRRIPMDIEDRRQRAFEAYADNGAPEESGVEAGIEVATQVVITREAVSAFREMKTGGLPGRLAAALAALGFEVVEIQDY